MSEEYTDIEARMGDSTVLIVDDDPMILIAATRNLKSEPYDVATARDANDALKRIQGIGNLAAVLTDFNMPGLNGLEFLQEMQRQYPDVTRMLWSGMPQNLDEARFHNGLVYVVLPKPFERDDLKAVLESAVKEYLNRKGS